MRTRMMLVASLFALVFSGTALAQPEGPFAMGMGGMGRGMRRHGMGPGMMGPGMGGGMRRCMRHLMMAPPEALKARLGLSDQQIGQIQSIRTNVLTKSIKLGSEAKLTGLQLIPLMQSDIPDEGKVLAVHRKVRSLLGQIAEERIKAGIAVLKVLSKDQRAKMRAECLSGGRGGGPGKEKGKGFGGGWGQGGWGRGGGWGGGLGGDDDPMDD
jgi:Spy/CpxP family protein refolding chaperone